MLEIAVFVLTFAADLVLKLWSMLSLSQMPGGQMNIIPGVFWLRYIENHGEYLPAWRSPGLPMDIFRITFLIVSLVILVIFRRKLGRITRVAFILFMTGLVGNMLNFLTIKFVPDMLVLAPIPNVVFNLADIYVVVGVAIIFIRIAFYERSLLFGWMSNESNVPVSKKKRRKRSSYSSSSAETRKQQNLRPALNAALPEARTNSDFADLPPAPEDYVSQYQVPPEKPKKTPTPEKIRKNEKKNTLPPENWPERFPPPSDNY